MRLRSHRLGAGFDPDRVDRAGAERERRALGWLCAARMYRTRRWRETTSRGARRPRSCANRTASRWAGGVRTAFGTSPVRTSCRPIRSGLLRRRYASSVPPSESPRPVRADRCAVAGRRTHPRLRTTSTLPRPAYGDTYPECRNSHSHEANPRHRRARWTGGCMAVPMGLNLHEGRNRAARRLSHRVATIRDSLLVDAHSSASDTNAIASGIASSSELRKYIRSKRIDYRISCIERMSTTDFVKLNWPAILRSIIHVNAER